VGAWVTLSGGLGNWHEESSIDHAKSSENLTTLSGANSAYTIASWNKRWFLTVLMLFAAPATFALIVANLNLGSVKVATSYVRGEPLAVDAKVKSFGKSLPGQTQDVTFFVTNHGPDPFRVVGCRADCTCTAPKNLPMSLSPGETKPLHFTVHTDEVKSDARISVTLYTTLATQRQVDLSIIGEVAK